MGICSSNLSQSILEHPTLGALKHDAISMKLQIFLPHESAYFHLAKTIHRLRYASEVKNHLYLPLSQKLQSDPLSCSQTATVLLTFPPYFQTMEDVIQKREVTTELQLMRILHKMIACTKYFQRHAMPQEGLCPVNILVMKDQTIKIVFKQMLSTAQHEIAEESQESQESQESHKQRIGVILLAIASLSTHGTFFEKDNSLRKKMDEPLVNSLLKQSGSRYSDFTVQIMRELIYEKKSSLAYVLKRIEKHVQKQEQTDKEEPTADSSKDIENDCTSTVSLVVPEQKTIMHAAEQIRATYESIL